MGSEMKNYILLRHGHSAANASGRLTGQLPGIGLSPEGQRQAKALVDRIGGGAVDFLHLSPIERCQLTIDPWLRSKHSRSLERMEIIDGFTELDFGRWSGRKLTSLRKEPMWREIQSRPSKVTFPEGESFRQAQRRSVAALEKLREISGSKTHLIVSHSDTIKLILSHYLGQHLDNFQRIHISPASFTLLRENNKTMQVVTFNNSSSIKEILDL